MWPLFKRGLYSYIDAFERQVEHSLSSVQPTDLSAIQIEIQQLWFEMRAVVVVPTMFLQVNPTDMIVDLFFLKDTSLPFLRKLPRTDDPDIVRLVAGWISKDMKDQLSTDVSFLPTWLEVYK